MHVDVPAVSWSALREAHASPESAPIRDRVCAARDVMRARGGSAPWLNGRMPAGALRRHCGLDSSGERLLDAASRRCGLSARACHRILRVARTVADLAGADTIRVDDLAEAIQFRAVDGTP
jgi:magnesium chelatase family protein